MNRKLFFIALFACFLYPVGSSQIKHVTENDLKTWVGYLASDEMKGRRNGSPEMKIAAEWIAGKFAESGLKTFPGWNGFFQEYTYSEKNERNVAGWIEGSDPVLKNEYLVLTAHFDHIGTRVLLESDDTICNGADDNAAGTATIIGIAKALKLSGKKPARSIIFAAFSGEENGMKGSRWFVAHSPVPLKLCYANMNFEMTGHSESLGKDKYYMTGCKNSTLDNIIIDHIKGSGFQLVDTISITDMLFNASDNISFSRLSNRDGIVTGIPSGTFATTTLSSYLHTVNDEAELFDFANMARLVNHFADVVLWLSGNKNEVKWTNPSFVKPVE